MIRFFVYIFKHFITSITRVRSEYFAVIWPKKCRCGVKHYMINQRSEKIRFFTIRFHFTEGKPGGTRIPFRIRFVSPVVIVDDVSHVARTVDVDRILCS